MLLVHNLAYAPLPFGRICFVVLVMRKGGESSWSGPWHAVHVQYDIQNICTLYIGSSPCAKLPGPVHIARLGWACFLHI